MINEKCKDCLDYEQGDVYVKIKDTYIIENRYVCTVTGYCKYKIIGGNKL